MSWTYLDFDDDGDRTGDGELPGPGSAFLSFDALRWRVCIGFLEDDGCEYVLDTEGMTDDSHCIAWASLDEPTEPDQETLLRMVPWEDPGAPDAYSKTPAIILLRGHATRGSVRPEGESHD